MVENKLQSNINYNDTGFYGYNIDLNIHSSLVNIIKRGSNIAQRSTLLLCPSKHNSGMLEKLRKETQV